VRGVDVKDWKMDTLFGCPTISTIAAEAKRLDNQWSDGGHGGLSIVVVDYLSLMRPSDRRMNRVDQVEGMIWECKEHAMEMQVPWLVLSQFNREGSEGRPEIRHLKHASAVEQTANTVILLDFDTPEEQVAPMNQGGNYYHLLVRVGKQRSGMTQGWNTAFRRRLCGFRCGTQIETRDLEIMK